MQVKPHDSTLLPSESIRHSREVRHDNTFIVCNSVNFFSHQGHQCSIYSALDPLNSHGGFLSVPFLHKCVHLLSKDVKVDDSRDSVINAESFDFYVDYFLLRLCTPNFESVMFWPSANEFSYIAAWSVIFLQFVCHLT